MQKYEEEEEDEGFGREGGKDGLMGGGEICQNVPWQEKRWDGWNGKDEVCLD